jgi:peptidoglycan/xylan/chitin deacetylase (PgdA/CDA1 family)
MTVQEWHAIYDLLGKYDAKLTVAVTAAWVESEEHLIPFPMRFPGEASVLKEGLEQELLEIANHGLTHCVLKDNAFKPRPFTSNRRYHREFWDWIPLEVQEDHIRRSQDILQNWFRTEIVTFVPPGNVFTDDTLEIAQRYGLQYVSCKTPQRIVDRMAIVGDERVLPLHDRDIVLNGVERLRQLIADQKGKRFCFVRELGKRMLTGAS